MIFWSGFGFLVGVVLVVALLAGQFLTGGGWSDNTLAQAITLAICGLVVFVIDKVFISKRKDENLINPETGAIKTIRKDDSFMFLPFRFWPYLLLVLAAVYYITKTQGII